MKKLHRTVMEGRRINPVDVERRIGRLKERHSGVAQYYLVEFNPYQFSFHIPGNANISKRLVNSLISRKSKADKYECSHKKIETELEKLQSKYHEDYSKISIILTPPSLEWELEDDRRDKLVNTDGNYIIKTNRKDLCDEEIWKMYIMLARSRKGFS